MRNLHVGVAQCPSPQPQNSPRAHSGRKRRIDEMRTRLINEMRPRSSIAVVQDALVDMLDVLDLILIKGVPV